MNSLSNITPLSAVPQFNSQQIMDNLKRHNVPLSEPPAKIMRVDPGPVQIVEDNTANSSMDQLVVVAEGLDWQCKVCTLTNRAEHLQCDACGTVKE